MKTRKLWKGQNCIIVDVGSDKEKALMSEGWQTAPCTGADTAKSGVEAAVPDSVLGPDEAECPGGVEAETDSRPAKRNRKA